MNIVFEYKLVMVPVFNDEATQDFLNSLGRCGWELILIFENRAYFKRTKRDSMSEAVKDIFNKKQ